MRVLLILILSLVFLSFLFLSDFFLSSLIKEKINACNKESQKHNNFKAISLFKIVSLGTFFWLVPLVLFPETVKLEYKIILTLFYWFILSFLTFKYIAKKSTLPIAKKSLPFLVVPALLSSIIFVPSYVLLKDFFW